jgi:hypothetical protein
MVNLRRPRLGARTRRTLTWGATTTGALVAAGVTLGPWALALLVAFAATGGLVAGWAAVEARVFPPTLPPAASTGDDPGPGSGDHVAFARALTAVAATYLAECERQERQR